jgi:hypothetical protein
MSYCRYGPNSDVYVIRTFGGELECLGCRLTYHWDPLRYMYFSTTSELEMIGHLIEHRTIYGHLVPERTLLRLTAEWERHENVHPLPPRS